MDPYAHSVALDVLIVLHDRCSRGYSDDPAMPTLADVKRLSRIVDHAGAPLITMQAAALREARKEGETARLKAANTMPHNDLTQDEDNPVVTTPFAPKSEPQPFLPT